MPDHCTSIILSALDLPVHPDLPRHDAMASRLKDLPLLLTRTNSIIIEAELLPYNEACRGQGRGPGIEEFWHLSRIRANECVSL
jgi:DNA ligase-4